MKKILIIGSNGKEGNLIATEAKNRGFLVTGLGQSENKGNVCEYKKKCF